MKHFLLVIIALLFSSVTLPAKTYSADSLRKALLTQKQDTERVNTLLRMSSTYEDVNSDSALNIAMRALKIAHQIAWPSGIAYAQYDIGIYMDIQGQLGEAEKYYDSAVAISIKYNFRYRLSQLNNVLGNLYSEESQYSKALDYYYKSLGYDTLFDKGGLSGLYNNIGLVYAEQGNYVKAEEYYFKSLEICEATNDKDGIATTESNLGNIYNQQGDFDKSLTCYQKSIQIDKEINKQDAIVFDYADIGNAYYSKKEYSKALSYFYKSIALAYSIGISQNISNSVGNIGLIFTDFFAGDSSHSELTYEVNGKEVSVKYSLLLDSALRYQNASESMARNDRSNLGLVYALKGEASIYVLEKKSDKAITLYKEALALADTLGVLKERTEISQALGHELMRVGNYEAAAHYLDNVLTLKDSLYSLEKEKQSGRLEAQFEYDKKLLEQRHEREKEEAMASEQSKREKLVILCISLGLITVSVFLLVIFRRFRITNEQKKIIEKQKTEVDDAYSKLNSTHALLQEKDKDITDSIAYARKIQNAILPSDEHLKDVLGDFFVLYKPRDVVSGDFYWCHQEGNMVVFAVVDCTGHGVPGAFMSMIGNSTLGQVVIENGIYDAAEILNRMRNNLIKQLQQKGQESISRDGMDMAVCVWNKNTGSIQYSGANNSAYITGRGISNGVNGNLKIRIHGDDMIELLPDKQPMGYQEGRMETAFTSQIITLKKGNCIYLSSDGYQDQFGGERNKKFTSKGLRNLLTSIYEQPIPEQKKILNKTIEEWKGSNSQTDDICVMGVKI